MYLPPPNHSLHHSMQCGKNNLSVCLSLSLLCLCLISSVPKPITYILSCAMHNNFIAILLLVITYKASSPHIFQTPHYLTSELFHTFCYSVLNPHLKSKLSAFFSVSILQPLVLSLQCLLFYLSFFAHIMGFLNFHK
ncbi:hypothetical protein Ancab_022044 [Ancistrocladus abbreviatus]